MQIRNINVIFTSSGTTITETVREIKEPYLKIEIKPSETGGDIGEINIVYNNMREIIDDEEYLRGLKYNMNKEGDNTVERAIVYMKELGEEEVGVIVQEYMKYIENGVVLDGLISGMAAYITFLVLNEKGVFRDEMLYEFSIPYTVSDNSVMNRNLFKHLSLVLTSLSRVSKGILRQLVIFVQSFINIWEPLYINGPAITTEMEARMATDIISGLSQYVAEELAKTKISNEMTLKRINDVENKIQMYMDRLSVTQEQMRNACQKKNEEIKKKDKIQMQYPDFETINMKDANKNNDINEEKKDAEDSKKESVTWMRSKWINRNRI